MLSCMRVPGRQRAGSSPLRDANPRILALAFMLPALASSILMGACAAVQDMAGIPRAGFQKDGTYVVNDEEEKLACRQIKERIDTLDRKIKSLPAKAALEEQRGPQTVGSALGRWFGAPGDGLSATTEYQRANAESDAMHALLARKQCV
jgi:hypothetical protein